MKTSEVDVDLCQDLGHYVCSRLLPLLLLVMLFMWAVAPAVDLTAGEKERGTLETLLVAPVSALEVMKAKFIAVTLTAAVAALANLAAMSATFALGMSVDGALRVTMSLSLRQVLVLLCCLLPS